MADTVNPSGFNRDKPRSGQSGSGSANCSTVKKTAATYSSSTPICGLCRNQHNTLSANYATFLIYQDPRDNIICTPCAESIRDALL